MLISVNEKMFDKLKYPFMINIKIPRKLGKKHPRSKECPSI